MSPTENWSEKEEYLTDGVETLTYTCDIGCKEIKRAECIAELHKHTGLDTREVHKEARRAKECS